jgi:hypothetical protein
MNDASTQPPSGGTPAGWYDDPEDPSQYRYWNGQGWTADRSPKGTSAQAAAAQPAAVAAQPAAVAVQPSGAADYPVRLDIAYQQEYNRLLPLVKWLLLFPHYFVLIGLGIASFFVWIVAAFAILFTRTYPTWAFDFILGVFRWGMRVNAYYGLMTDEYPPFALRDDASQAVNFDIAYPEQGVDRWRPFFAGLLAWPYNIVAAALVFVASILSWLALFAILFTKRFPESFFEFNLKAFRWQARGAAYSYAMTTKYPPWELG